MDRKAFADPSSATRDVWAEVVEADRDDALDPPKLARRQSFEKARDFDELLALVEASEERLAARSVEERILAIRGLYYGTRWSKDFIKERSRMRNAGFWLYTGKREPPDPRRALGASLFEALRQSQDVRDGHRALDFGHLVIGLDARYSEAARDDEVTLHGATGLEIVTWVGDLGGGTGNLAAKRVQDPKRSVSWTFQNKSSDYGAPINLEGDVAAYLVGRDPSAASGPSLPRIPAQLGLAGALRSYLKTQSLWEARGRDFLTLIGAEFSSSGKIENREELLRSLAHKLASFGQIYLVLRKLDQDKADIEQLYQAARHVDGVAGEVATVFVDILQASSLNPGRALEARGPFPEATPPAQDVGEIERKINRMVRAMTSVWRDLGAWF